MDIYKFCCEAEIEVDVKIREGIVTKFGIGEDSEKEAPKVMFIPLDEYIERPVLKQGNSNDESEKKLERGGSFKVEVFIEADNFDKALKKAYNYLKKILDILSFLTLTKNRIVKLTSIENQTKNEIQKCTGGKQSARFYAEHTAKKSFPSHELLFIKMSFQVQRALRFFRSALINQNLEDRFLNYYIALESISDELKFQENRTLECPHCHEDTHYKKQIKEGIIDFAKKIGISKKEVNELNGIRSKIVHSDIEGRMDSANLLPHLSKLEFLLINALKFLLKLKPNSLPFPEPNTLWNVPEHAPYLHIEFVQKEEDQLELFE